MAFIWITAHVWHCFTYFLVVSGLCKQVPSYSNTRRASRYIKPLKEINWLAITGNTRNRSRKGRGKWDSNLFLRTVFCRYKDGWTELNHSDWSFSIFLFLTGNFTFFIPLHLSGASRAGKQHDVHSIVPPCKLSFSWHYLHILYK